MASTVTDGFNLETSYRFSLEDWLSLPGARTGSASASVSVSVGPNAGAARVGTITVAGITYTVRQDAASAAPARDQVVPFVELGDEHGDVGGIVLQIGVHGDDDPPPRGAKASIECGALA